jgi:hypothetical protein
MNTINYECLGPDQLRRYTAIHGEFKPCEQLGRLERLLGVESRLFVVAFRVTRTCSRCIDASNLGALCLWNYARLLP